MTSSNSKGNKDKASKTSNDDIQKHHRSAETGRYLSVKDGRALSTSVAKEAIHLQKDIKAPLIEKDLDKMSLPELLDKCAQEARTRGLTEEMAEKLIQELDEEYRNDTSPILSPELEETIKKEGFTEQNLKRIEREAEARALKRAKKF